MRNRSLVIGLLVFAGIISACSNHIVPKPRAYFRIDLPDKHYSPVGNDYPYMFEIPDYARYEAYAGDVDRLKIQRQETGWTYILTRSKHIFT